MQPVSGKVTTLRRMSERTSARRAPAVPLIGEAIRRLRKLKNMSIQDLADASGVSVGMLSQIERDRANPSLRIITSIREALDVPVSALFDEMPGAAKDPEFVRRAANHPRLDLGSIRKELLSPRDARGLQFMVLKLAPKTPLLTLLGYSETAVSPINLPALPANLSPALVQQTVRQSRRRAYLVRLFNWLNRQELP